VGFLNDCKVRGIAMFGATGEFPHFTVEERMRLGRMAIKRSHAPVIVNVTHSCLQEAVVIAEDAINEGAAGLLLMPPYFFRYGVADIREYYLKFIEQMRSQAPLLLYNLPAFNNAIPIEVAVELLTTGAVAGIKDSGGDWSYFSRLLAARQQKE